MPNRGRVRFLTGEVLTQTSRRVHRKVVVKEEKTPVKVSLLFKTSKTYDRRGKR